MRVRPLGRTFTVVRFSKLARSCALTLQLSAIAHVTIAAILRFTFTKSPPQTISSQEFTISKPEAGLYAWAEGSIAWGRITRSMFDVWRARFASRGCRLRP